MHYEEERHLLGVHKRFSFASAPSCAANGRIKGKKYLALQHNLFINAANKSSIA